MKSGAPGFATAFRVGGAGWRVVSGSSFLNQQEQSNVTSQRAAEARQGIQGRHGKMSVAIWSRQEQATDGHAFTPFSIRVQKRYLDPATQEWKTADYLFADDLPRLILVAQEAYRYISLKEKEQNTDVAA